MKACPDTTLLLPKLCIDHASAMFMEDIVFALLSVFHFLLLHISTLVDR